MTKMKKSINGCRFAKTATNNADGMVIRRFSAEMCCGIFFGYPFGAAIAYTLS